MVTMRKQRYWRSAVTHPRPFRLQLAWLRIKPCLSGPLDW